MATRNSKKGALPPADARRILAWRDLPRGTSRAAFEVTDAAGKTRTIHLGAGNRRVVEGLIRGPIYAASPVRLSDRVLILRRDYGVEIECEMFDSPDEADNERFGIYRLLSRVTPLAADPEVAQ